MIYFCYILKRTLFTVFLQMIRVILIFFLVVYDNCLIPFQCILSWEPVFSIWINGASHNLVQSFQLLDRLLFPKTKTQGNKFWLNLSLMFWMQFSLFFINYFGAMLNSNFSNVVARNKDPATCLLPHESPFTRTLKRANGGRPLYVILFFSLNKITPFSLRFNSFNVLNYIISL